MTDDVVTHDVDRADVVTGAAGAADGRGRLVVSDRAVQRIAALAAREVPGVRRAGSTGLDGVLGRRYPTAGARVAGGRVSVDVDIAVAWPDPLAGTAFAVRERVRERVEALTGLAVDRVHVTIAKVTLPEPPDGRTVS